ncbi:MAG TPA: nicotinamide riboside transporter PnuC [Burkholderiaceae bacterium]|nr:nicotinamide riboside transporter PnuC [Burkholderiaceae bacterium]HMZ02648.1 nicotinamide riboside transporter PnuC [Burkholderiaceae bacterium]HNG79959.1 nicotinamide riboside transporter PnuC [Burkholderiaceae bacterium]
MDLALPPSLQPWLDAALTPAFTAWGSPFSWLELLACVISLVMVWANLRVWAVAWPLAIVASLLYFLLFWDAKLYGDGALQIVFVVVAFWGWWQWLRGRGEAGMALKVRELGPAARWGVLGAGLVLWPVVGLFLWRFTDTDVPWWDAFPTAFSLVGQWLLGRKYVENWPVWLAVNVVGSALFAYKGLWLTVGLYALFAGLSVVGWRAWRRKAAAAAAVGQGA